LFNGRHIKCQEVQKDKLVKYGSSVTSAQSEKHIPDAYEIVVGEVSITTAQFPELHYAIILDPVDKETKK